MASRSRKNYSSPPGGGSSAVAGDIKEAVGTVLATFSGPSTTALAQGQVAA
jgi:hypothetical protein